MASPPDPEGFSGTRIESDAEIRAVHGNAVPQPPKPVPKGVLASAKRAPAKSQAFRPLVRPPMAVLTVYDDGKSDGRVIRIMDNRFLIGRSEGDLLIPHDELISSRHLEITRLQVGGGWRWTLTDLQSTNGLYVRVSRTTLADRSEILVGSGRYRFDAPSGQPEGTVDHMPGDLPSHGSTRGWAGQASPLLPPALTELIGGTVGNRILLMLPEYWIGSDPNCSICRQGDPFCEPRQTRIFRNAAGVWNAEHPKTLNGLWNRVAQVAVQNAVQFQIGEQRFRLTV